MAASLGHGLLCSAMPPTHLSRFLLPFIFYLLSSTPALSISALSNLLLTFLEILPSTTLSEPRSSFEMQSSEDWQAQPSNSLTTTARGCSTSAQPLDLTLALEPVQHDDLQGLSCNQNTTSLSFGSCIPSQNTNADHSHTQPDQILSRDTALTSQGSLSTQAGTQITKAPGQAMRSCLAPCTFGAKLSTVAIDPPYSIDRFLDLGRESIDGSDSVLALQQRHLEHSFDPQTATRPQARDHDMELREVGSFQEDFLP